MTLIDLALIALVALVCGVLAQLTSGYSSGGWIVNLGMGFLGALAGTFVSRRLNAPLIWNIEIGDVTFPIIYCLIGAVFFLAAINIMVKPSRR